MVSFELGKKCLHHPQQKLQGTGKREYKTVETPGLQLTNSGVWAHCLALVSLGFLTYKIRVIIVLISKIPKDTKKDRRYPIFSTMLLTYNLNY